MIYILLGIVGWLILESQRKVSTPAVSAPASDRVATVSDVIETTLAAVSSVVGRVRDVVDYGTSQGLPESGTTVPSDPGDTPGSNPDKARVSRLSARRVTQGPLSASALSRAPMVKQRRRALPERVPVRTQSSAIVPYSPFARVSRVDRIKALIEQSRA